MNETEPRAVLKSKTHPQDTTHHHQPRIVPHAWILCTGSSLCRLVKQCDVMCLAWKSGQVVNGTGFFLSFSLGLPEPAEANPRFGRDWRAIKVTDRQTCAMRRIVPLVTMADFGGEAERVHGISQCLSR